MIFQHSRFQVWNANQHPYRHTPDDFGYSNSALPPGSVTTMGQALDWLFAVLYPNSKEAVDTVGDLPAAGNSINDMRVVRDDGDGKAASYRWEQREGEVSASWHKIYDMDWGYDSILSGFFEQTQDVYVNKYGRDDVDASGTALTGAAAGQHIYGGKSANTHLTLHANSGDGTGAQTGYIQAADNIRPTSDSAWSLGTTLERWLKVWTDEITVDTMTISSGSILDTSGVIDFGTSDLVTTGDLYVSGLSLDNLVVDTMSISSGSITDLSGAIDFDDEDLSTTGDLTVGGMLIASGSITDSSGTIDFNDENLITTGNITGADLTGNSLSVGDILISSNTITTTLTDGHLYIDTNGSGNIYLQSPLDAQSIISTILAVDNLSIDDNTISATNIDGSINLSPNGIGDLTSSSRFRPISDNDRDLGAASAAWATVYLKTGISDGSTTIGSDVIQSFRDAIGTVTGQTIFWNDLSGKWEVSLPDDEIDHGAISGLDGDDHTHYMLLAGRSGGQSLIGGTDAGDDLILESTSNVTKGNILLSSVLAPGSDDTLDLGTNSLRFADIWMTGEAHGLRLENFTTAGRPSASAGSIGRLIWDIDLDDIFVDLGGSWRQITSEQYYEEDPTGWDGSQTSVTYDVSGSVNDSRRMIWVLKKNSDDYEQVGAEIDFPSATSVRVTVGIPLAAGTYSLVGR